MQGENQQNYELDDTPVYLAGREGIDTIFTLDRRDFSQYRTSRNRAFHLIPE